MSRSKPAPASLHEAVGLHRAGRLDEARKLYEQALRGDPRNADALHLLGLVLIERGEADKGFQLLRRAVAHAPRSVEALNNLAVELCRAGRPAEALGVFDRLLALDGALPGVHFNHARALRDTGRRADALAAYDRALRLDPGHVAALADRGSVLAELGRFGDALAGFDAALLAASHAAAFPTPADAAIHRNRGNALHALDRSAEAVAAFDAALAARPGDAPSLHARGTVLVALGRLPEASTSYEEALALRPDDADLHADLGNVLRALQGAHASLDRYDRALALRPGFPAALDGRGLALLDLGRAPEAAEAFAALLAADPDYPYARGRLLHARQSCADWSGHEALSRDIRERVARGERADVPFLFLAHGADADLQLRCAAAYVADKHPAPAPEAVPISRAPAFEPAPIFGRAPSGRIRVAYLSGDFRTHPVSFLMAGVFEHHDRARFETVGVSFRPPEDSETGRRVARAFDRFVDVSAHTDAAVAALMREAGIDIAVDLMGHTANSRTGILARRAAPVQVNYLGYPGTMGAGYIDAIIADDFVVPPGSERFYAERVVRLPHCFQANDAERRAGPTPSRAACGLPDAGLVVCAFNNTPKINPASFAAAMRLLAAVPGSVLWLLAESPDARAHLAAAAGAHGIAAGRLVFAPRVAYPAHLARLRLADLFLDSFPFNGGTTVSDALWAGVPVVTCAGEAFASRMAGSLLRAAGLPDLVAADLAAAEVLARRLGGDAAAREAIRDRLARARTASPLFDTALFCRHLEAAFATLHAAAGRGEAISHFAVEP